MKIKTRSFHRWPICPVTGLQRLGEMKDVKLALRAASRSRTNAAVRGGTATWYADSWFRCSHCNGGFHLCASDTTTTAAA